MSLPPLRQLDSTQDMLHFADAVSMAGWPNSQLPSSGEEVVSPAGI